MYEFIYINALLYLISGISTISNWAAGFVVVTTFLSLMDAIGLIATLGLYVSILIASFLFVWSFIPETKKKEIIEILR